MDFDDTPEEAAFRAEAHAWLSDHARLLSADTPPPVTLTDAFSEEEQRHVWESKAWQATLYDGGWAGITWPKEYGGRGGTPIQSVIFAQEQFGEMLLNDVPRARSAVADARDPFVGGDLDRRQAEIVRHEQ